MTLPESLDFDILLLIELDLEADVGTLVEFEFEFPTVPVVPNSSLDVFLDGSEGCIVGVSLTILAP